MPFPIPWPYGMPYPPCGNMSCSPTELFTSPDGTRAVWIQGLSRDAYLYDRTGAAGFESRWLDWEVEYVNFIMDDNGGLVGIEVRRADGQFEVFDTYGERVDAIPMQRTNFAPARRDLSKPVNAAPSFKSLATPNLRWD